ncbi:MAG: hypothetical protein M1813_006970 [Trichoglossum hirsutum]|nr:MAG: hypothetical protein M1813_006970 [Trichoglossum hirsutum]
MEVSLRDVSRQEDRLRWLENGAELESKDSSYVKLLLENGAELESKDSSYGQTPLSWAAGKGYDSVVKLLLENGAKLESKDSSYRQTPLSWAAGKGHDSVVPRKLLLENNAELESKDSSYGQTPLSWAAGKGHDSVVKLLLENGAKLESKDSSYGQTPLSWAAGKGHDSVVPRKLLLENGAELESKDSSYGQTPLSWAAGKGHDSAVPRKLLLENDAELESKDSSYGQTPLSWAAGKEHDSVVKLLLENDAELVSKDSSYGQTPLLWAAEKTLYGGGRSGTRAGRQVIPNYDAGLAQKAELELAGEGYHLNGSFATSLAEAAERQVEPDVMTYLQQSMDYHLRQIPHHSKGNPKRVQSVKHTIPAMSSGIIPEWCGKAKQNTFATSLALARSGKLGLEQFDELEKDLVGEAYNFSHVIRNYARAARETEPELASEPFHLNGSLATSLAEAAERQVELEVITYLQQSMDYHLRPTLHQ